MNALVPPPTRITFPTVIMILVFASLTACHENDDSGPAQVEALEVPIKAGAVFEKMTQTEEVIGELTGQTNRLKRAIFNLDLSWDEKLFSKDALYLGLASREAIPGSDGIARWNWSSAKEEKSFRESGPGMWSGLFDEVRAFTKVGLGTLEGNLGKDPGTFSVLLKVSMSGMNKEGHTVAWKGKIIVDWQKQNDLWLITKITTKELGTQETAQPLFVEVLERVLTTPGDLEKARHSIHDQYVKDVFFTGGVKFTYPKEYWIYIASWDSLDQHTSVSVVDIDNDGWDDFYVTARWGRNQLWRNRGDGTFEDIAGQVGLDLDGVCNCSLFADFDNDGDKDVFIGRSLERGRYFVNEGGRFIDHSEVGIDSPLPYWTSSISSADVNGDGLLDLYLSTYRLPISKPQNILAREFLSPEEQNEWKKKRGRDHPVFRLTGPPNILLINQGNGEFKKAPSAAGADLWLNSFQGTWADYDNDGDPDLFVANDYAPDAIFRNDEGKLMEVTSKVTGGNLQGFGMGVSLGDYDNDGLQDPYFTYMYSKAGSRITAMFEGLEDRMYDGVTGNKIFKNSGEKFVEQDAGAKIAGWSWGGQFSDLNNDGFLDLYVANGLYTPPAGTETAVDL